MNNFAKGSILTVLELSTQLLQNILHINFGSFIELARAYFPLKAQNSLADAVFFPLTLQRGMTLLPGKVHGTSYDSLFYFYFFARGFLMACFCIS